MKSVNIQFGDTITMEIGHSEAALATRVAGTVQNVLLINRYCAVLVDEGGNQISAPYLPSELGIMDANGRYYYITR